MKSPDQLEQPSLDQLGSDSTNDARTAAGHLHQLRTELASVRAAASSLTQLLAATAATWSSNRRFVAAWNVVARESSSGQQSAEQLVDSGLDTGRAFDADIDTGASANSETWQLTPTCLIDPLGDMAAWQSVKDQLALLIGRARRDRLPVFQSQSNFQLLAIPYHWQAPQPDWFCAIVECPGTSNLDCELCVVADHLELAIADQGLGHLRQQGKALLDVVSISNALARAESIKAACITLANRLRQTADAQQVAIVIEKKNRSEFEVAAISDVESFDAVSDSVRTIRKAALRAVDGEPLQIWHNDLDKDTIESLPLKNYAQIMGSHGVINLALLDQQQRPFGALLWAVNRQQIQDEKFIAFVRTLCERLGSQLYLVHQAKRRPWHVLREWLDLQRKRPWFRITAVIAGLLALAMLIPLPYRVGCDCEVQPVVRRFVAAPHEGVLANSLVGNGEVVQQGQVLATMDGRRLRMELAALEAQFKGQKKTRDSALARGNVAESQIAAKHMERIESEIDLKQSQLDHLDIRSPIDGVVVSGDLENVEGAPLEMGQQLFEIGPLENMLVQLSVPECEIQFIKPGMPVKIRLASYPFQVWKGQLKRVHARAEVLDDQNVFVAEVELDNKSRQLRPGMKGHAKIISDARPVGWNLFHHSWDALRRWVVW